MVTSSCKIAVCNLQVADNVCGQVLRELDTAEKLSIAHVNMNPRAWSLLHKHQAMDEVYVITEGVGYLEAGEKTFLVQPGHAVFIPAGTPHRLRNASLGALEHLVLALPPFIPEDVYVLDREEPAPYGSVDFPEFPTSEEAIDGAEIVSYVFDDVSVAFGRVKSERAFATSAHFHDRTTEWIYVLSGFGEVLLGNVPYPVARGDFVKAGPKSPHVIRCRSEEDMVVVCICNPAFNPADVHHS